MKVDKRIHLEDLICELFLKMETAGEAAVDDFLRDYPEFREELLEAADYRKLSERLPERIYTNEEDERLSLKTASVVQDVLHSLRHSSRPSEDASTIEDLTAEIVKTGESVESFASRARLSDIVVQILSNREVLPASIPRRAVEIFCEPLKIPFEAVLGYLKQPPRSRSAHYKAEGAPHFVAQFEFASIVRKDPMMSEEDKAYWLSLAPIEKD
jgi:hypothetical protein